MKTDNAISTNNFKLDLVELNKTIKEHQNKLQTISIPSYIEFEEKNISNVFDLFKEDKDNTKLMNRRLVANPYASIYEIPSYYVHGIKECELMRKNIKILVYPNYIATGKFRIDFRQLNMYGDLIKSLFNVRNSFSLLDIIQNVSYDNNNLEYSLIEKKIISTIRNLLCNQSLVLE